MELLRWSYDFTNDYIVLSNLIDFQNKLLATHGLGHFFSLLHTFKMDLQYNPNESAPLSMEIDTSSSCAQNCETVADMICDTPPDY